ncbi:hypothetical protein MNBD_GAMMA02-871 [hydrothermal vent metagenome]|uniref:Uncharacterized protein n=1 Tax=hydrothermal vent metagenome TaxID=652676 RepID=A0A3B0WXU9_9ZZZZ
MSFGCFNKRIDIGTRSLSENRNRDEGKLGLGLFFALFDDKKREMAQTQLFCNRFSILGQAPSMSAVWSIGK